MGWNEPDNDKDPWRGRNSGPPDLDDILKQMKTKFKQFKKKSVMQGRGDKSETPPTDQKEGNGLYVLMLLGLVIFLWVLSGIFIVDPAEQAAILRLGRYVRTVGPGPHWIPRLIESKIVLNVERVADYSYSAQMLTKDENLVSVAVAVQYRIGDLQEYLFQVNDAEESLQQATSSALRQVVGTTTLDQLITEGRDAWGSNVQDTLTRILESYKVGITVVNVSPQPARAPENVQEAFDDAIKAQEDEKRFKEQAWAYAARVVPMAEGKAKRITEEAKAFSQQVVLAAEGETAEFLQLLLPYQASPKIIEEKMYFDTMTRVLQRSTKVLIDGKAGQMLYLPLDKLIAGSQTTDLPALKDANNKAPNLGANPVENSVPFVDERLVTRPVEPVGRAGA